jgi:dihydrofolate reductase
MRKIIVATFISLDGVMQAPGGPNEDPTGGFTFGGWNPPYASPEGGRFIGEFFGRPFDLLLGRKTYDIFAAHWPYVTDVNNPVAAGLNRAAKYVASRAGRDFTWANSRWLGADTVAALKALKSGDGPDLIVQGSSELLQTLWANGLIDEFSTLTFPVLLGNGKRLFAGGTAPSALKLVGVQTTPTGVIIATYRPDGAVRTGDYQLPDPTEAELERRRNLT